MTTKFLEPGGDADFAITTTNGFWGIVSGTPTLATDFVHGGHKRSIQYPTGSSTSLVCANATMVDAGGRISFYVYLNALPSVAKANIFALATAGAATSIVRLYLTPTGVLQLWRGAAVVQIGSDGATLNTGQWYRISFAYTIASSTVNEFRLFVDSVLSITASNTASLTTGADTFRFGNFDSNAALDMRTSDHYADNSSALTDTGNVWVTVKRPNANGTANGFTTQIGSGGSGYGTGHSPQVNERALSTSNGWSMVGAGSAVTEEYNIESAATGDIDISPNTLVDYMGWVSTSALVGETAQIVLNGVNFAQAITSTNTVFKKFAASTTYPSGTGADIGITTDTSLTTVSLFECGIIVAYIVVVAPPSNLLLMGV